MKTTGKLVLSLMLALSSMLAWSAEPFKVTATEKVEIVNHSEKHDVLIADAGHDHDHSAEQHGEGEHGDLHEGGHGAHHLPALWSVIPFVALLLMIATGPLFYAHFWHHHYPKIAIGLGLAVVAYYIFALGDVHHPVHALAEYASFISLLTVLFVASGGILINVDKAGKPLVNIALLVFGAAIANLIGTTGASMLLIRPFIRLNEGRIKAYHVVFFIFMVSNVGGSLTPIGDPPLFLGFLKGIAFEWTIVNLWTQWIFGIGLLALIFFFIDSRNKEGDSTKEYSGKVTMKGARNIIFLAIAIAAVFIDPNVYSWVPGIEYDGAKISFFRELIMFATAFIAYKTSDKECLEGNGFNFEPILEVAFIFIGIFGTMLPALQLVGHFATNNPDLITTNMLYWATGSLSGVLDNAPTYLNFLAAALAKEGMDIGNAAQVAQFSHENGFVLSAISVAAVFFGAMTYIGNAPNFMVKSIAEQSGIEMPAFAAYIVKYSIPFLLPVLFLTWFVFFYLLA